MYYSLPINLIRQYCFCPRIPYFQELLKIYPSSPQWVKQGKDLHDKQEKIFLNRTLKRFNLIEAEQKFNIFVSSEKMKMHGLVDSILLDKNKVYPIEFKLSGNNPKIGQILQVIAYGILLEEKYKLIFDIAFILYEKKGKTYSIKVTEEKKKKVFRIRDKIIKDLDSSFVPNSSATTSQCTQCEYLNYCNDRN